LQTAPVPPQLHVLPLQAPLQQSTFVVQVMNEQLPPAVHSPPRQELPQQSASVEQKVPTLGVQVTQTLFEHWPLQQSPAVEQESVVAVQVGAQGPLLHCWLQQ